MVWVKEGKTLFEKEATKAEDNVYVVILSLENFSLCLYIILCSCVFYISRHIEGGDCDQWLLCDCQDFFPFYFMFTLMCIMFKT